MDNPWKRESGIHPEVGNGHRRIETSVLRALTRHPLTGTELRAVLAVIDKTYGYQKTSEFISQGQIAKALSTHRNVAKRTILSLEAQNILVVERDSGPRKIARIMFNKYHDTWLVNHGTLKQPNLMPLETPGFLDETAQLGTPGCQDDKNDREPTGSPTGNPRVPSTGNPQVAHNRKKISTKEKTMSTDENDDPPKYTHEALAIASRFKRKILEWKPDWKQPGKPTFENWQRTIDRMIRIDRRSPTRIARVIKYATENEFWQSNILSPRSLRKHFDTLEGRMREPRKSKSPGLDKSKREKQAIGEWLDEKLAGKQEERAHE